MPVCCTGCLHTTIHTCKRNVSAKSCACLIRASWNVGRQGSLVFTSSSSSDVERRMFVPVSEPRSWTLLLLASTIVLAQSDFTVLLSKPNFTRIAGHQTSKFIVHSNADRCTYNQCLGRKTLDTDC
jgi:hypothetical protein